MSTTYTLLHLTDEQEVEISIKRKAEDVEPVIMSKMEAQLAENSTEPPVLVKIQFPPSISLQLADVADEVLIECSPFSLQSTTSVPIPQQALSAKTETYCVHEDIEEELLKSKETDEIDFDDTVSVYPLPLVNNLSNIDDEAVGLPIGPAGPINPTAEPGTDGRTWVMDVRHGQQQ